MIDLLFRQTTESIVIRIQNNKEIVFAKVQGELLQFSSIEGLKLSLTGILKQFPDLEGKPKEEIRKEAIKRFKDHIQSLKTEKEIIEYIVNDLKKYGFEPQMIHKKGFRPRRLQ